MPDTDALPSTVTPDDFSPAAPPVQVPDTVPANDWEASKADDSHKAPSASKQSPWTSMEIEAGNKDMAANQHTSPYLSDYKPEQRLGDASVSDEGKYGWVDQDGKFQEINGSKHVLLQDPETGKHVVFARGDNTNTGAVRNALNWLGGLVSRGYVTDAPGQMATLAKGGEAAAAAARQGIDIPKGIATPNEAAQSRAVIAAKVPWVGQPLRDAAGKLGGDIADRTQDIANKASTTGRAMNLPDSGAALRESLSNYLAPESKAVEGAPNLASAVSDEFKTVDPLIKDGTTTTLPRTRDAVFDMTKPYWKSGLAKVDEESGTITPKSGALQMINGPIRKAFEGGQGFDYPTAKFLRTYVGKLIQNPGQYAEGLNEQELKRLYGAVTDDLRDMINKGGGQDALNAWDKAQSEGKSAGAIRGELTPLLNTQRDEQLFEKVRGLAANGSRGGVRQLALIKNGMKPDDWQNVGANVINRLGQKTVGNSETFSPLQYAKDWNNMSDQGKDLLFGTKGAGGMRDDLEDIATISGKYSNADKIANTGGHGVTGVGAAGLGFLAAEKGPELLEMFKNEPLTAIAHLGYVIPAAMGGRVYAKYLSTPAGARTVARWMRSIDSANSATGKVLNKSNTVAAVNNANQTFLNDVRARMDTGQPGVLSSLGHALSAVTEGIAEKLQ